MDPVLGAAPIAKVPYRLAPPEIQKLFKQPQSLMEKGFIRLSSSLWGALILFVKKKDGLNRMCTYCKEVNKFTV